MPLATSTDHGHNLQTVQLLIKKNQVSVPARVTSGWQTLPHIKAGERGRALKAGARPWALTAWHRQHAVPAPQTLQKEIQGHQPRIDDIFERSQSIVTDSSSLNAEAIRQRLADLRQLWGLLIEETEKRHRRLEEAQRAQQYYFDAAEAEAWMSEQELYMMSEEKAKVRGSAQGGGWHPVPATA